MAEELSLQQLALCNGFAGEVLAGLLVCSQARDPKLPAPQDLAQGVEVIDILQGYYSLTKCPCCIQNDAEVQHV